MALRRLAGNTYIACAEALEGSDWIKRWPPVRDSFSTYQQIKACALQLREP